MSSSGARPEIPPVPADEEPARSGRFGWRRRVALLAAVAAVVVAGGIAVATTGESSDPSLDKAQVSTIAAGVVKKAIENLQSAPAPSAVAYQQILPSLVEIETERSSAEGDTSGLGAGVIINANGSIMTALHVVAGARDIRVSFVDGTKAAATIASTDPKNDIAVLEPERGPETIVPAVLGGGGQVGDVTYAVGHPLGFAGSLSSGVISGLNRSVTVKGGKKLTGLIQFDAAVNPGNSGGPLLDRNGQVIGIVTALANPSRDGYFIGLGFAVPIGTAGGGAGHVPQK
jgi:S1-C subfamily serine protease